MALAKKTLQLKVHNLLSIGVDYFQWTLAVEVKCGRLNKEVWLDKVICRKLCFKVAGYRAATL